MKKFILSVFAAFAISSAVNAQDFNFKKGSMFVEGNIRARFEKSESWSEKSKTIILAPRVGYFLNDKTAVGVDFMYLDFFDKNTNSNSGEEAHGFSVGAFGRHYFLNLGSRFKTYAQVNVAYTNTHNYDIDNGVKTAEPDYISYSGSGTLGFNFFLTNRLSINYSLADLIYVRTSKYDATGYERDYEYDVNLNVFNNIFSNSTFGLTYRF